MASSKATEIKYLELTLNWKHFKAYMKTTNLY